MKASPWLWSAVVHFGILGAGAGVAIAVWHEPTPPNTRVSIELPTPKPLPPRFTPRLPGETTTFPKASKSGVTQETSRSLSSGFENQTIPVSQEASGSIADDVPPQLVDLIKPRYPSNLRRLGVMGSVKVECKVSEQGHCWEALVVQSSGHPEMDNRAVEALRRAQFEPRRINGRPEAGQTTITVQFHLE